MGSKVQNQSLQEHRGSTREGLNTHTRGDQRKWTQEGNEIWLQLIKTMTGEKYN